MTNSRVSTLASPSLTRDEVDSGVRGEPEIEPKSQLRMYTSTNDLMERAENKETKGDKERKMR